MTGTKGSGGLRNYVATAREVADRAGGPWPLTLARMLLIKGLYGLSAVEYGMYSLHERPFAKLSTYRTKKQTTTLFERINPEHEKPRVEDKLRFHRLCLAADLPVPKLHAIVSARATGGIDDYPVLAGFSDMLKHFAGQNEIRLILKPQNDALGTGVRFVCIRNGIAFDIDDRQIDVAAFSNALDADMQRDDYLVQGFVQPHPVMAALSSGKALGTFRIVTYLQDGQAHLLYALARIPSGSNVHDNFSGGSSGNLIASIAVDSGVLGPAFGRRAQTPPRLIDSFTVNPDTGRPIAGQEVPAWGEIRAIVQRASEAFHELPFLGWDFALSVDGVIVIEANSNPDIIGAQVSSGLGARELLWPLRALDADT